MKPKLSVLVAAGFLFFAARGWAQDTNFFVFLCFGQSNMEGFPGIEERDKGPVDERFRAAVDFPGQDRKKGERYAEAMLPLLDHPPAREK